MGEINHDLENGYLKDKPTLKEMLSRFLYDFDINWGAEISVYNTKLPVFIIKPSEIFSETYGFSYEILLAYSMYEQMQARTMQAINSLFNTDPARGRVETLTCIIISDADNTRDWVSRYVAEHQDLRTYVIFKKEDLLSNKQQSFIGSEFRKQLNERDLFDVQLPLLNDMYFFGRQNISASILNSIKRCENRGIFGLRKTGKTSLLYKIKRLVCEGNIGYFLIYDCKNAKIRKLSWTKLLNKITLDIAGILNIQDLSNFENISDIDTINQFEKVVSRIPDNKVVVLAFDEIEFISFNPPQDKHWEKEFFDFWQVIWSTQSSCRKICFIISGVNPSVAEKSSINKVQNPMFGIVHSDYIQGLEREDIHDMARKIGRRMGMKFDYTAIDYLKERYGGHPLLTRLALSYENKNAAQKPIDYTKASLQLTERNREFELAPYCQHIVDVLEDYYEDEYLLLEFLATGDVTDFQDLATSQLTINHLVNYGLVEYINGIPRIGIPVVGQYILNQYTKKQGKVINKAIVPIEKRPNWVKDNIKSIISYIRQLESIIRVANMASLFGPNSFPQADKLIDIPVANSENEFSSFISVTSNCFVESIKNYGNSIHNSNYFWTQIKGDYPALFDSLLRINAYRNWQQHLALNKQMQEIFDRFIKIDLEGKQINETKDGYFILQQCCLSELKLGISSEISRLS